MRSLRLWAVAPLALCWAGYVAAQEMVTPPIEVDAAAFVPPALMQGEGYSVQPLATNDGYVSHYRLDTQWGEVDAVSDYRLRVRIQEVHALAALDAMSRAGVFGDSLLQGALAPVNLVVDLVTEPVDTVSGAVKGVGRWFGNIAKAITSKDPHQENALSTAAGWAATKRAFAVGLGVDPYTDWQPLQDGLTSVGRAAFAGGITAKVALGAAAQGTVAATPVTVLNLSDTSRKTLIDNPPERLAALHRQELAALGMPTETITAFLANYNYSPMEKLQLVDALKGMKGAGGLEIFLADAAAAPDKGVARYMQQRALMMARFHGEVAPISILATSETPLQRTADGRILGLFPLDDVLWTADLAAILGAMSDEVDALTAGGPKELWLEGVAAPDARQAMESRGWTVKERVHLLLPSTG